MAIATQARADTQTQADVLAELRWDARVQPNAVGVSVKDGIVTLTGCIDSYTKKWAAEEIAHRIRGVEAVVNVIEVRLPGTSQRTDADIAAAATRALEWHPFIPEDRVNVTVSKGCVTLDGEVEWNHQRESAERAVRNLLDVKGVTNMIKVKSRVTRSNLKQRIDEALKRMSEEDARRITVEVDGSKVILRGTVRSRVEKQAAERTAWSAHGVMSVDNRMTISFCP